MARLQILQLPEGADDGRPPFILVIDEVSDEETERVLGSQEAFDGIAGQVGARAVLVFHGMTIQIPANDVTTYGEPTERSESVRVDERAMQAEEKLKAFMDKRYEIEQKRKTNLTDALGMDRLRDWDDILNAAAGLRKERDAQAAALDRVLSLPEQPQAVSADRPPMEDYLYGYGVGVRAAKRAASTEPPTTQRHCGEHDGPCFPQADAHCVAHGDKQCLYCHRNPADCARGGNCSTWRATGMHWDSCANRVRGSLASEDGG